MDFATFLIQLLNSVQYGLLLFMLAAGLTLIFGIMGVVNLAHGSFYMLGAYLAYSLSGHFGSLALAIVGGALLSVVFGLALEWLLFRHFYHRDHLDQVRLTFGLISIFEELRSILWGDDVHGVPIPKVLDWSIQAHGAAGVSDEFPLAYMWAGNRTLRIADGPDEVHHMVVGRAEMSRHYLSHVAAGRRNISGAFAARIAAIYGEEKGISQEEATERLFEVVAEKKNIGTPRQRGEHGRFVKGELGGE